MHNFGRFYPRQIFGVQALKICTHIIIPTLWQSFAALLFLTAKL